MVNQTELSVSHKEGSTAAKVGEETQFSSQRTVMQSPLRKDVSVTVLVHSILCFPFIVYVSSLLQADV